MIIKNKIIIRNITIKSESKPKILNFHFCSAVDTWYKCYASSHWQGQWGAKGREMIAEEG